MSVALHLDRKSRRSRALEVRLLYQLGAPPVTIISLLRSFGFSHPSQAFLPYNLQTVEKLFRRGYICHNRCGCYRLEAFTSWLLYRSTQSGHKSCASVPSA
jgi:hypothetical protein